VDRQTCGTMFGCNEDTEENKQTENGRSTVRSREGHKVLAVATGCPQQDSVAW
jgi:hypothetical protein